VIGRGGPPRRLAREREDFLTAKAKSKCACADDAGNLLDIAGWTKDFASEADGQTNLPPANQTTPTKQNHGRQIPQGKPKEILAKTGQGKQCLTSEKAERDPQTGGHQEVVRAPLLASLLMIRSGLQNKSPPLVRVRGIHEPRIVRCQIHSTGKFLPQGQGAGGASGDGGDGGF
jgi:hypothetical protein